MFMLKENFFPALALCATLLNACRSDDAAPSPAQPAPVRIERVRVSGLPRTLELSGSLEASKTVKLGFLVAGRIDSIPAGENAWVEAGKLIARLDPANYQAALDIAEANLDQVQDEFDRLAQLQRTGSVSPADFSKVANGLRQAKAQRRLQQKNLADTRLSSPISGILIKRGAEVGEIAPVGAPLFVVAAIQPIRVVSQIPEQELRFVRPGQRARVKVEALDLEAEGVITQVGKAADPASRAFPVEAELPNADRRLLPGMVAEIRIPQADSAARMTVPLASLRRSGSGTAVFAVDSGAARVYLRKVALGKIYGDRAEILSGLAAGEWVVADGASELQNGTEVKIAGAAE
jgi:RND family efflux transporter MFP subunit